MIPGPASTSGTTGAGCKRTTGPPDGAAPGRRPGGHGEERDASPVGSVPSCRSGRTGALHRFRLRLSHRPRTNPLLDVRQETIISAVTQTTASTSWRPPVIASAIPPIVDSEPINQSPVRRSETTISSTFGRPFTTTKKPPSTCSKDTAQSWHAKLRNYSHWEVGCRAATAI